MVRILFNTKTAVASRKILILVSVLIIPYLFILAMLQRAGGGNEYFKYWIPPLLIFLALTIYILYRRNKDKQINTKSNSIILFADLIISFIAIIFSLVTVYAMVTWNFEIKILIIQLAIIVISLSVFIDDFKDIRVSR